MIGTRSDGLCLHDLMSKPVDMPFHGFSGLEERHQRGQTAYHPVTVGQAAGEDEDARASVV
jgi:hypothetical protein